MIEYLPWSQDTYLKSLERYLNGEFSCLDIELGGECNYHCVYCDSPDRKKLCTLSEEGLIELISSGKFDWIYICGLGEPTYNDNYKLFIEILHYCKKYGVKCSIFSNLSNLTEELVRYLEDGVLYIFFKYDTNNVSRNRAIYGIKEGKKQLQNIEKLKGYVHLSENMTNLAASIVPTKLNKEYILPIVEECLSIGIYPLLGELELSGKGEMNYENLCLSEVELLELKDKVEDLIGEPYKIPSCPSVISGIHFSYDGYITVDRYSGLSCHWFWLKEPETVKLMPFTDKTDMTQITDKILFYRDGCMEDVKNFLGRNDKIGGAFGGCGGEVREIFSQYYEVHKGRK